MRPVSTSLYAGLFVFVTLGCHAVADDKPSLEEMVHRVGGATPTDPSTRVDMDELVEAWQRDGVAALAGFATGDSAASSTPTAPTAGAVGATSCPHGNELDLPLVTHWDEESRSMRYLATGTPQLPCLSAIFGPLIDELLGTSFIARNSLFCDLWPSLPNYEQYWGEEFALYTYEDHEVTALFDTICNDMSVGVRLLNPDAVETGRVASRSNKLQVLHARQISGALATIFLPPGWDADAPEGTYHLFVTGAYDINNNLMNRGWTMSAVSVTRPDTIGILWNGGSTANSVSGDARMRRQFDDIVDFVARDLGGNRHSIVITGGSRLGNTAISLAGNPDPHDYTIRYAQVAFPGMPKTLSKENAWAWGSSISAAFGGVGPYTGQPFAWGHDLESWSYPADGPENLRGLNKYEATLTVLYGHPDADVVNELHRPYADRFIDALLEAGTRVRLEISSHDFYMENKLQVDYANKLLGRGVPVEVLYTLHAGHRDLSWVIPAVAALDEVRAGLEPTVTPGWTNAMVTPEEPTTRKPLASYAGELPFTLEHPRFTWRGAAMPLFVAAQPGTDYAIGLEKDGWFHHAFYGRTPVSETAIVRFDVPASAPVGWYNVHVFARYPGQGGYERITGTPACEECMSDLYVGRAVPSFLPQSAIGALLLLSTPGQGTSYPATSWGVADTRQH